MADNVAESITIKVCGRLQVGMMAIGGETTGTTITAKGIQLEVTWGDDDELARRAGQLDGQGVCVSGALRQRTGPERGRRLIIEARSLERQAMDSGDAMSFQLESLRWKKRPFVIFSPSEDAPAYREQTERLDELQRPLRDRNMSIVRVVGDEHASVDGKRIDGESAKELRANFEIRSGQFTVVLIGKDGTEKLRSHKPLALNDVFKRIDSMPMRKRELHREQK